MAVHHESVLVDHIVCHLTENDRWEFGSRDDYDPVLGLDTRQLFGFVGATQPDEWNELLGYYGNDVAAAQFGFAKRVGQEIEQRGLPDVLRTGVKDHGVRIRVAYFKPSLVPSAEILNDYYANRLTVVRELAYAAKHSDQGNRLDLTLFLNGIPVATAEAKNLFSGQGVEEAKKQYREDRDPAETIFARRVVANFAVDPRLVFVAPRLRGKATRFLPFNQGTAGPGNSGGAGNPAPEPGRYATSYLWEQVWQSDNWLELLERYVHLRREKISGGRWSTSLIFPRYHQWDAVRKLAAHAARHGTGNNYLVMHSAGSGKSNTIAWLAHRLASLHTPTDPGELAPEAIERGVKPGEPAFDKIVIITDRTNLDSQLRETVGSFEQTAGLVVKIDGGESSKSAQLAKALSSASGKILTVTLQTFPALVDYLRRNVVDIQGRRYAIVLDEAHSSQSGDAATAVRKILRELGLDADDEDPGATSAGDGTEARLKELAGQRSQAPNLSYFAFTATPKAKTLELFGTPREDGKYWPFHTYSMRQAIDEGFILDPLRNYVTFNTYWKLVRESPDDVEVDPAKANPLLARFALLHPSTTVQHAEIIVEHFRAQAIGRLGGRSKAMVVTASRLAAVKVSRAIKQHIADCGYPDIGVLVAFSGTVDLDGEEVTESGENGISEKELPKAFAYTRKDDRAVREGGTGRPEYRILVVAEKYQTGFDQPLLTTMYVNKKLHGIAAVQTLSRLNRTASRKSQADLAVLDFVNEAIEIQAAFLPFYENAAALSSDPNMLYAAQNRVMSAGLLADAEMQEFIEAYLAAESDPAAWTKIQPELYRLIEPAVRRHAALLFSDDEADRQHAEDFRVDLRDFTRKYAFLAQIVPYRDAELERLYRYGRYLLTRLERREDGSVDIGEVDLTHLRVERTGEHDLGLSPIGMGVEMRAFNDGAGGAKEPERSPLSAIIDRFNERYGTNWTKDDFIRPYTEAAADDRVQLAGVANTDESAFGDVFDEVFAEKMAEHIDTMNDVGRRFFSRSDPEFRSRLTSEMRREALKMIRRNHGLSESA